MVTKTKKGPIGCKGILAVNNFLCMPGRVTSRLNHLKLWVLHRELWVLHSDGILFQPMQNTQDMWFLASLYNFFLFVLYAKAILAETKSISLWFSFEFQILKTDHAKCLLNSINVDFKWCEMPSATPCWSKYLNR